MNSSNLTPKIIDINLSACKSCSRALIYIWLFGGPLMAGCATAELIKIINEKQHIISNGGPEIAFILLLIFSLCAVISTIVFEVTVVVACNRLRKIYPEIKKFYSWLIILSPLIGAQLLYPLSKKIIKKRIEAGQASDQQELSSTIKN